MKKFLSRKEAANLLQANGESFLVPGVTVGADKQFQIDEASSFHIVACQLTFACRLDSDKTEKHHRLIGEKGDYLVFNPQKNFFFILPPEVFEPSFKPKKSPAMYALDSIGKKEK